MIDKLEEEVDLIERHVEIFRLVIEEGPIGIVNLSNETDYPHHKVRYSLRVLEEAGLIDPTAQGAVVTDEGREFVDDFNEQLAEITEQLGGIKVGEELLAESESD